MTGWRRCLLSLSVPTTRLETVSYTHLYEEYKKLSKAENKVIFGGRLGEYKYYDMDAVIASVLEMGEKEIEE